MLGVQPFRVGSSFPSIPFPVINLCRCQCGLYLPCVCDTTRSLYLSPSLELVLLILFCCHLVGNNVLRIGKLASEVEPQRLPTLSGKFPGNFWKCLMVFKSRRGSWLSRTEVESAPHAHKKDVGFVCPLWPVKKHCKPFSPMEVPPPPLKHGPNCNFGITPTVLWVSDVSSKLD